VLTITPIACLKDNYAYLVETGAGGDAWVVDPSEAAPVVAALAARKLRLQGILATHHHVDHTGGIDALVERGGDALWVGGHASDRGRIPRQTVYAEAPRGEFVETGLRLGPVRVRAAHIPGHTRGAIAWALADADDRITDVFTGDTLFAGGCGRLFEGTAAEMWQSLQLICSLPESTRLWFGHEYTAKNLVFAAHVEPDNRAVAARAAQLPAVTTPTTVADERATNPFVRAATAAVLAERRAAKDNF
jgi:hydroxyacylglutathione hydrolase